MRKPRIIPAWPLSRPDRGPRKARPNRGAKGKEAERLAPQAGPFAGLIRLLGVVTPSIVVADVRRDSRARLQARRAAT